MTCGKHADGTGHSRDAINDAKSCAKQIASLPLEIRSLWKAERYLMICNDNYLVDKYTNSFFGKRRKINLKLNINLNDLC